MMQRADLRPDRKVSCKTDPIGKILLVLFLWTLGLTGLAQDLAVLRLPASISGDSIQRALDGMSQGGEVDLAAGIYELHQPIILRHNHLTLRGTGPTTILHLSDKANCPVLILGAPANPALLPMDHLQVANLFIDGNRRNQQVELWHPATDGSLLNNNGIDIWRTSDATVAHVICCHCRSGGMVTSAGTRRLIVNDFTSYDNQFDGLACYLTEDSHFTHLHLYDNLSAGISLDLSFVHNVIEDAQLENNDLGIFMRSSRDNSFQKLTINRSRHHGVFMAQSVTRTKKGWQLVAGTECTGNNFAQLLIDNCGGKPFLINNASCTNNVVAGVRFQDNSEGGLDGVLANVASIKDMVSH